jgi:hypothetical protein
LIEMFWRPNPSLEMLKELGFMQRWKGGCQPDPLADVEANQFLLEGVQGCPPQAANTDLVALSRVHSFGKSQPQVGEGG